MYCRYCGAKLEDGADMCDACYEKKYGKITPAESRLDMSQEGRGAAIASIVLAVVGLFSMLIGIALIASEIYGLVVFLGLVSLATTVVSVIMSVRGIKAFIKACKEKAVKPIASLVCGIVGLNFSVVSVIYWIVIFIVLMLAIIVAANGGF